MLNRGSIRRSAGAPLALVLAIASAAPATAAADKGCAAPIAVCTHPVAGGFALIRPGRPATVLIDANADPAVRQAATSFAEDLGRVGGRRATLIDDPARAHGPVVLIGVRGQSPMLDRLIAARKIAAEDLAGQWEAYRQIVVEHPLPGVPRALVVIGSDRRGAVFGTYDLSARIGVSPWYWFADVPVARHRRLDITPGARRDQPKVRYRGFFINDEDPSFSGWAKARFGGVNARMYRHVFELELRLMGNYFWPAMWGKAFHQDDPENGRLADAMGIVIGSSHHEPMMRAQAEWHRPQPGLTTGGPWDYTRNGANLRAFWRGGIARMMSKGGGRAYDSLVTIGMRGDGDEAMGGGTATALLEKIVADQRAIIADVTGRPAAETPQIWALYKEVQDYYDHGMRVPDDVILLFSDDNWGQLRRLPAAGDHHPGGYGIYYHFDYVGAPRNYKWINTNAIEKIWQQMDLAYQANARAAWIVNVGDLKPMEYPLSFFLRQAWDPDAMTLAAMQAFPRDWAAAAFGPGQAAAIGALLTRYGQGVALRKPELLDPDSFPLGGQTATRLDGGAFGRAVETWTRLERDVARVRTHLAADQRDAYFELVEHPVRAMATLYRLYYAVAWNHRLAGAGDPRANVFADRAEAAFAEDQALTRAYHALRGGKWDGMMRQTHIGYTGWQEPARQIMPAVTRIAAAGPVPPIRFATLPAPDPDTLHIEAADYVGAEGAAGLRWAVIPHLGSGRGAVTSLPQGRAPTRPADGMRLDYAIRVARDGPVDIGLTLVPTLDTSGAGVLRTGVSLDDGPVAVLEDRLTPSPDDPATAAQRAWTRAVIENRRDLHLRLPHVAAGAHRLSVWRLDGNVVLGGLTVTSRPDDR
ncbi:glycosyl hydrolase 115 family protein [Sphingomonas morindae]|uniref:Glycosyl hydrolase 115 family protein n=1 Tax=Sphingomonas morindae TaxID=1541170 RepID=A0ABY4XD12_9SPHN|nr:glycosyl hydrolase 115 family protein [Sphingomonas morindae]USI74787.1 glycosyl hydrolase 115 family protein [Sphingomonas morindae]